MTRVHLVAIVAIAAIAPGVHAQDDGGEIIGLPLGARPEPVVIEDLEGNPYDLGRDVGRRPVLLQFWASWCENCEALRPEMAAAYGEFGDEVTFLAVAVAVAQSKRSVRRHVAREPVPYSVVWDTRGRATRAFKAPTTSYVVILDATGAVTYTGVGPEQDVRGALGRVVERAP